MEQRMPIDHAAVEMCFANALLMMKHSSPAEQVQINRSFLEEFLIAAEGTERSPSDADSTSSGSHKRMRKDLSESCDSSDSQMMARKNARGKYRCGRCGQQKTNHICALLNTYACLGTAATQVDLSCLFSDGDRVLTARSRSISEL